MERTLDHIEKHPGVISWNDKDECILYGKVVAGSNIFTLVKNLFVEQADVPHRNDFLYALASTHIPLRHISNTKIIKALKDLNDPKDLPAQSGQGLGPPGIRVSKSSHKLPHKA